MNLVISNQRLPYSKQLDFKPNKSLLQVGNLFRFPIISHQDSVRTFMLRLCSALKGQIDRTRSESFILVRKRCIPFWNWAPNLRAARWQPAHFGWALFLVVVNWPTQAAQPTISKIEPYGTNQVLIHFDVQANTTCALQWTDAVKSNRVSVAWSNLWTSPNLPFFEHYIITDTRSQPHRFYRLQVSQ